MDNKSNIRLVKNEAFGNPNYRIVRMFLNMVDNNMMQALGKPFFSTKQCEVIPTKECPMCSIDGDGHVIRISAKDDYWCRWVYEFAHEYCHHIIDGALTGEWCNLLWFEETICELSSIFNLHKMIAFCGTKGLKIYIPDVKKYRDDLLNKNAYDLTSNEGWYYKYASDLSKDDGYKRELYNAIAALIFPLFKENPHLWKIILHIGDIRSWNSLEDLFSHLIAESDESYKESLIKLKLLFK